MSAKYHGAWGRPEYLSLLSAFSAAILTVTMTMPLMAKKKQTSEPLVDRIEVVGHVALEGKAVSTIHVIDYHGKRYLYLEDGSKRITIVDVTDAARPTIGKELELPEATVSGRLEIAVGDAAVLAAPQVRDAGVAPATVSIVDFSDLSKPRIIRQFENVSAMKSDPRRGLVFLSNNEGLWLLLERPAPDLEAERAYQQYLLYNH